MRTLTGRPYFYLFLLFRSGRVAHKDIVLPRARIHVARAARNARLPPLLLSDVHFHEYVHLPLILFSPFTPAFLNLSSRI